MGLTGPCCKVATLATPVSNGSVRSRATLFWIISRRPNGSWFLHWLTRILLCLFLKLFPSVPLSLSRATAPWAPLSRTAATDGTSHRVTSPLCPILYAQRCLLHHCDGPNGLLPRAPDIFAI